MKNISFLWKHQAFTLIELMIVIGIIGLLAVIAIPNFISYRNKVYCASAEIDADHVAAAIADYFGAYTRTQTPAPDDLKVKTTYPFKIFGIDPNQHITIEVEELTHRCPADYQAATPGWDGNYNYIREIISD